MGSEPAIATEPPRLRLLHMDVVQLNLSMLEIFIVFNQNKFLIISNQPLRFLCQTCWLSQLLLPQDLKKLEETAEGTKAQQRPVDAS